MDEFLDKEFLQAEEDEELDVPLEDEEADDEDDADLSADDEEI